MKDNVKRVGIGLVVLGSIGYLWVLLNIVFMATGFNQDQFAEFEQQFGPEVGRMIELGSQWIGLIFGFAGNALLLFGGLQMMKMKSWGVCVAACIFAMVPCFGCCCIGIPLGGFGLYLLFNAEIKQAFNAGALPS